MENTSNIGLSHITHLDEFPELVIGEEEKEVVTFLLVCRYLIQERRASLRLFDNQIEILNWLRYFHKSGKYNVVVIFPSYVYEKKQ